MDASNGMMVETIVGRKRFLKFLRNRKAIQNRIFVNRIDNQEKTWNDYAKNLCRGAARSLTMDNAGGASVRSEALSIHVFEKLYDAKNVLCEMEVQYETHAWSMVDYLATIAGKRVGVSVFRAMVAPHAKRTSFTMEDARRLCAKKLRGLVVARNSAFRKNIGSSTVFAIVLRSPLTRRD